MDLEEIYLAILILSLSGGLLSTVFGLPGTIVIFIASLIFSSAYRFEPVGFWAFMALFVLMAVGELTDYLLGVKGAIRFRLSFKSLGLAVAGGTIGAVLLSPWLLGLGIMGGLFLGAWAGVAGSEFYHMHKFRPSLRNYRGLVLGGVAAGAKGICSLVMIVIVLANIYG